MVSFVKTPNTVQCVCRFLKPCCSVLLFVAKHLPTRLPDVMWALTVARTTESPPFISRSTVYITISLASRSVYAERGHLLARAAGQLLSTLQVPDDVRHKTWNETAQYETKRNGLALHSKTLHSLSVQFLANFERNELYCMQRYMKLFFGMYCIPSTQHLIRRKLNMYPYTHVYTIANI